MKDQNEVWTEFWTSKEVWIWILRFSPTYKKIVRAFDMMNLPKDARILDAGCGTGKLARYWQSNGYDVLGVDISDGALAITKRKSVRTLKADISKGLPFQDKTFDLVYSDGLLEHFLDPEPVLAELFRVSGNYVLTIVPRVCVLKTIIDIFVPPPKEYKKKNSEWVELHRRFEPTSIRFDTLFTALAILCNKGE